MSSCNDGLIGYFKLSLAVNDCLSLYAGPVRSWGPGRGVPSLPEGSSPWREK